MKDINANPDKDWNWYWISYNPTITMKDINYLSNMWIFDNSIT